MKPGRNEIQDLLLQAATLLSQLHGGAGSQEDLKADDLLLFLYRLRDGYSVVRTTRDHSAGSSFGFLPDILYQLESRPDEAMQSEEWRSRIELLLRDLAEVGLTLSTKSEEEELS